MVPKAGGNASLWLSKCATRDGASWRTMRAACMIGRVMERSPPTVTLDDARAEDAFAMRLRVLGGGIGVERARQATGLPLSALDISYEETLIISD